MSNRSLRLTRRMPASGRKTRGRSRLLAALAMLAVSSTPVASCTPKVQVEAPKEPITINLNIKLDADVRLKVEEVAKEDVRTKPIF